MRIALAKEAFNKRKEFLTKGEKQNTKKENGKSIGVASSVVWMRNMDVEKRGNKQIGGTGNLAVEKVGKDKVTG